jgi:hypothetical protein
MEQPFFAIPIQSFLLVGAGLWLLATAVALPRRRLRLRILAATIGVALLVGLPLVHVMRMGY